MSATGSGNSQPAKSETIVNTGENISEFDLLWLPCGTARIRLYTRGIGARASIEKPALRNSAENNTFNQQLEMAEHRLKESDSVLLRSKFTKSTESEHLSNYKKSLKWLFFCLSTTEHGWTTRWRCEWHTHRNGSYSFSSNKSMHTNDHISIHGRHFSRKIKRQHCWTYYAVLWRT